MLSVLHRVSVRLPHVETYVENIPDDSRSEAGLLTFASLDEAWYRFAVGSYAVLERQNSFNVHVSSRDSDGQSSKMATSFVQNNSILWAPSNGIYSSLNHIRVNKLKMSNGLLASEARCAATLGDRPSGPRRQTTADNKPEHPWYLSTLESSLSWKQEILLIWKLTNHSRIIFSERRVAVQGNYWSRRLNHLKRKSSSETTSTFKGVTPQIN